MKSFRRVASVFVLGSVAAAVAIVACGFPSPILSDENDDASAEAGSGTGDGSSDARENADTGTDAAKPDSAAGDGGLVIDSGDPDVYVERDAGGTKVDASACAANDCDCDNDGFNDLTKLGCADAGGENDCDDTDQRVRPNQQFLEIPNAPRGGDWNCKNGVEKAFYTNVGCGLLALGACNGVNGFKVDPACGAEAQYVTCKTSLGLLCGEGTVVTKKQACK